MNTTEYSHNKTFFVISFHGNPIYTNSELSLCKKHNSQKSRQIYKSNSLRASLVSTIG